MSDSGDKHGDAKRPGALPGLRAGRRVTLNHGARPVRLPGESKPASEHPVSLAEGGSLPANENSQPLDAWTADRLRRSSLPPAGERLPLPAIPVSSAPPRELRAEDLRRGSAGDALDLVGRSSTATAAVDLASDMAERFALDDFTGALRVAEFLLGSDPDDTVAQHYARASREKLEALLFSRLTRTGNIPFVQVMESEIQWLGLDAQTGAMLTRIDGIADCETLIDISGVGRLEAMKALLQLVDGGVIRMQGTRR